MTVSTNVASLPDVQILGISRNTYSSKKIKPAIVATRVSYKQFNQSDIISNRTITNENTTKHDYTSRTYRLLGIAVSTDYNESFHLILSLRRFIMDVQHL